MIISDSMKDMNAIADNLLKYKIVAATPVPLSADDAALINIADAIHVLELPTLIEIYKEIGIMLLKYAAMTGIFLFSWWILSSILDEVAMLLGY